MFNDYLDNKSCYLELERSFFDYFQLTVQASRVSAEVFKVPYYNTFFQMDCHLWMVIQFSQRKMK